MKKQGKKIEVRFFETAGFHLTPTERWGEEGDCRIEEE
jgi:hypothetical protein